MERSKRWREVYRRSRAIGRGHRDAVLNADTHFGQRRRDRGLPPLDTPYQAIQSKGEKRGRVKLKYQEWPEEEVRQYLLTGAEYTAPDAAPDDPEDSDVGFTSEAIQKEVARKRRRAFKLGRIRRRQRGAARRPPAVRQRLLRNAMMGRQSTGELLREAAVAKGTTPEKVAADVAVATELNSQSEDPAQAAAELAAAAQAETDAELAEATALAAEVMAYTTQLAAMPDSDVAPDITTTELLDAFKSVPIPTAPIPTGPSRFPMPAFGGSNLPGACPTCLDQDDMNMNRFAKPPSLAHITGQGIPDRFGSQKQSTAIPLASNQAIGAGATANLALQPVSDIMPGAVLWVSFSGSTIAPEITALSVSGQNQLYGVAGAGLSQVFADVANLQAPGIFIPVKIAANNSFQLSITNRDGANPITVDVALVGTAVQLVQALKSCGA